MTDSSMKHFTRGGQITLHNIRMFMQISNKLILAIAVVFLSVSGSFSWYFTTEYERHVMGKYFWSTFIPLLNDKATTFLVNPDGQLIRVRYANLRDSILAKDIRKSVSRKVLLAFVLGGIASFTMVVIMTAWLKRRGKKHTEDNIVKGDTFATSASVKTIIHDKNLTSDLRLAGLPLIKDKETRHFFFHGTTGSGKSNGIKELLDQIRRRGDKAIIYDMSCNFIEEFYQPKKDIILNPMDVRGESWHLWNECRDSADYTNLAAAQIPMPLSMGDPFWINAARSIFAAAAFEMRHDPNRNIIKLLRYLLTADLAQIENYLKGTEAETLVSRKTEKTAVSIKSVLATYLKSMTYIKDGDNPFSIRQWIKADQERNWLFISSMDDRHETLKPLITAWLDITVNSLMSLPISKKRRVWLILDELTSLHRLPYLRKTLAKARKFGGCAVIGIQNYAELEEEYGTKGARSISALLNTRYFFREPDPDIAKWSAENFGEMIIEAVQESISYGANSIRDGVSINRVEKRKPVVSYSEIMSLDDLHAYVRLPGKFPITAVEFAYKERESLNEGIIPRKVDTQQLKEVNQLIEKYEGTFPALIREDKALKQQKKKEKQEKNKKKNKETVDQPALSSQDKTIDQLVDDIGG